MCRGVPTIVPSAAPLSGATRGLEHTQPDWNRSYAKMGFRNALEYNS